MSNQSLNSVALLCCLIGYGASAPVWAEKSPPGPAARDDGANTSAAPTETPAPADELRSQVRLALRQPLKTLAVAPYDETRTLVQLYVQLQSDGTLPSGERERLQNLVRTRLAQARGAIARSIRRRQTEVERTARRQDSGSETSSAPDSRIDGPAGGGSPQNEGQELVELIESTIAPASWEARGGRGVVKYWAPGHALVIRQTRDVHEQIGGVVGAMRP
jgi:hypothetical protein